MTINSNLSPAEFALFQEYIKEQCGIDFNEEKSYLIESRLSKFLIKFGLTNFEELYRMLNKQKDVGLAEEIIDAITTNETLWFRDKTPWMILEEVLLPAYIDEIRKGQRSKVRIWSAACSTGQEPYSIAMCIDSYLKRFRVQDVTLSQFEILATDISTTVLKLARMGKYDSISMARGLESEYRDTYFRQEGRIWKLADTIKDAVVFRQFNLQNSFIGLGNFDTVFCRYVTIYFSEQFKKVVFSKIANALTEQGVLFIGNSEIFFDYKENYEMTQYKNGAFFRVRGDS
ncbi:protein-glutamate O-methyltransferase CheR [Sporomusa sp.]|uniref:CheR family methyltransferase n=1 Tax=Sporomusa sp. TaxID=2078658 RepID=UPI002B8E5F47|nr:protein-glutamate O-methyltransferase CheR [Sporomusa sp.]HWR42617.1 protein-glutamate O-methyltransferase CheR [Sporomusa sp.]